MSNLTVLYSSWRIKPATSHLRNSFGPVQCVKQVTIKAF